MNLPAAVLLGIVQGLTEFLPVSSSAHLILARAFFGWEAPPGLGLAFDVALHVGTLAAILFYFRREVTGMALAAPDALSPNAGGHAALVRHIVIGTIPVVIVALLFNDVIEQVLRTPAVAAGALAAGALVLIAAERTGEAAADEHALSWVHALLIGCAQASALVPGVSRSGATIAIGMFLGFRRDVAARFTFLLAIPAMIAAAAKEAVELRDMPLGPDAPLLFVVGTLVSCGVGYLTIKYFLRFLAVNRLDVFAYYRLALAGAAFIWMIRSG